MAFRSSAHRASKALFHNLEEEFQRAVSQDPERSIRRAGVQKISLICLPSLLQSAIRESLQEYSLKRIGAHSSRLSEMLKANSSGWSGDEYKKLKGMLVPEAVETIMSFNSPEGNIDPNAKLAASGQKVEYSCNATAAYVAARMPCTFSSNVRVLQEVAKRLPHFKPKSLLDFGTGPGTSIWATRHVWHDEIKRITVVEPSVEMLQHCRVLLGGVPGMPSVQSFRSIDAASRKLRGESRLYDIVMSSYALLEVDDDDRQSIIRRLWSHTADMLVIIEPGTPKGWQAVLQARQTVLNLERKKQRKAGEEEETQTPTAGAHVVAPCPQDGRCPMEGTGSWCHFVQRVQRSELHRLVKKAAGGSIRFNHEDEAFSFVVLRRGPRPKDEGLLQKLPELREAAKDKPTITKEAFNKQAGYMKYLGIALNRSKDWSDVQKELEQGSTDHPLTHGSSALAATAHSVSNSIQEIDLATQSEAAVTRASQDEEDGPSGLGDPWEEEEEEDAEEMIAGVSPSWSRIVREPRRKGAHVILDMCCSADKEGTSGNLQRHIITKSSSRVEYRFARKAVWGDLWPLDLDQSPQDAKLAFTEDIAGDRDAPQSSSAVIPGKQREKWWGKLEKPEREGSGHGGEVRGVGRGGTNYASRRRGRPPIGAQNGGQAGKAAQEKQVSRQASFGRERKSG